MTTARPTRDSLAGRTYLDLRRAARAAQRTTDEYLRLYVLECFLTRLAASPHADRLIVKGGVLLAAYAIRRPTADIDVAARNLPGEIDQLRDLVRAIAAQPADDGVDFDTTRRHLPAHRNACPHGHHRLRPDPHGRNPSKCRTSPAAGIVGQSRRHGPEDVAAAVCAFADPLLESGDTRAAWDTDNRNWTEANHASAD